MCPGRVGLTGRGGVAGVVQFVADLLYFDFDCGAVAIAASLYTLRAQVLANRSPETNFSDRVNAWIRVGTRRQSDEMLHEQSLHSLLLSGINYRYQAREKRSHPVPLLATDAHKLSPGGRAEVDMSLQRRTSAQPWTGRLSCRLQSGCRIRSAARPRCIPVWARDSPDAPGAVIGRAVSG